MKKESIDYIVCSILNSYRIKRLNLVLLILIYSISLNARESRLESAVIKTDKIVPKVRFYGGYIHQHQTFFDEVFSFQGIEAECLLSNGLFLGGYGSAFVSNLKAKVLSHNNYFLMSKAGIVSGYVYQKPRYIHLGVLTTFGYLSGKGDKDKMSLFNAQNIDIRTGGFAFSPDIFSEINLVKRLKIRLSLGYNFYFLNNQSVVKNSDLQDISFTLGLFYGKFK